MRLADYMPEWLLAIGPWDLAWWQWIGFVVVVFAATVIGRALARVTIWMLGRVVGRTATTIDDMLLERTTGPLRLLGTIALARTLLPALELAEARAETVKDVLLGALAVVVLWGTLRMIDVFTGYLATAAWASRPASRALLSLLGRVAKVVVVLFAVIVLLGSLGLPVASLLAGLGIGGIALAFGAQKTVENLFGALAIGVDQPLREGDFVLVDSQTLGTVEMVGLRSTRIRTLDRTVISLPNGRLADMKVETFSPRDRCRLTTTIGVVYGTTSAQLADVMAGFERTLRDHPKIWPDTVVVRFAGFGASSLDIEIMAWFQTGDWNVFRDCRQDVLFGFMQVVERVGTSFAFPTRTIHLAPTSSDARPRRNERAADA